MEKGENLEATVIEQKGSCAAGHAKGQRFDISCRNSGGLCGFFYHELFPNLQTYEYGGKMPWWESDDIYATCPDPGNPVTIKISRKKA